VSAPSRIVTVPFTLTRAHLDAVERLAARRVAGRGARVDGWLQCVIQLGLAPLGGVFLYLRLRYRLDLPGTPIAILPPFLIVAGIVAGVILLGSRMAARVPDITLRSRFFRGNGAEMDRDGLTFLGPDSRWQTGWADIGALARGPSLMVACVGPMYFPIPLSALGDSAATEAAWQQISAWHDAARAGAAV
jgi:hypothetical protein